MKLFTVKSEGLAHYSYFLSDDKEAAVIDLGATVKSIYNLPKSNASNYAIS